jgi:hypothetical protein
MGDGGSQVNFEVPLGVGLLFLLDALCAALYASGNNFHVGLWPEGFGSEGGEWELTGLDNFRHDGQCPDGYRYTCPAHLSRLLIFHRCLDSVSGSLDIYS